MRKFNKSVTLFLINITSIIFCICYAIYMEHRCGRCASYTLALTYVLLPVFPLLISSVGAFLGWKGKSKAGMWLNLLVLALILAGLGIMLNGVRYM